MNEEKLPDWLTQTQEFTPVRDSDNFITKSSLKFMKTLSAVRGSSVSSDCGISASLGFVLAIAQIVLISLSQNFYYVFILLAFELVCMALLKTEQMKRCLSMAFTAMLLTVIFMVPALFLGAPRSLLQISVKVFLSVGLIGLYSSAVPWNRIIRGLLKLHVPYLFVLTLQLTLNYIWVLGQEALKTLTALQLRSVGRNRNKQKGAGGVLGVTYLKAQDYSVSLYDAMICRGFDADVGGRTLHVGGRTRREIFANAALSLAFCLSVGAFLYLEYVLKA